MSLLDNLTAQLPFGKKEAESQYFFALHIGTGFVTGAVWELLNNKVDILGQKTLPYTDTNDLLEKANLALDQSLGALEIEPDKILLGVPENWLEGDDLKEAYLQFLRKMMKEYELEPMAYVSSSLSLTHYLQKIDGVPPTAIMVGIDDNLTVSIVQTGKLLANKIVNKGDNLYETIENTLLSFSDNQSLPSKIILYSTTLSDEKLEKDKDELTAHHWMQRLAFLHLPKIETLKTGVAMQALVVAGASELTADLNVKHSFTSTPIAFSTPSSLGRLRTTEGDNITAVDEEESDALIQRNAQSQQMLDASAISEVFEPLIEEEQKGVKKIKHLFKMLQHKLQKVALPTSLAKVTDILPRGLSPKLLIPLVVIVIAVLGFLFISSAEVTVYVEPRVLTKDADIIADPAVTEVNVDKKIIPGSVVSASVDGSDKAQATGRKQIGDPAKGTVVILNKTDSPKTFSAGTALIGPSNLKFTLDSAVTVASQSAYDTGISFGQNSGSVTASAIGPDSNLSAGVALEISGQSASSYSAKADSAFSGGTSKEVTVVTSDDQKNLQSSVVDTLKKKAVDQLQGKLTNGQKIIPDALSVTKSDYTFSKRVNDQASEFNLNAKLTFKGTAYSDEDLKSIVSKLIETNVPEGFELNLSDTETQADVSKVEKDGKLVFKAEFKAKLLPKIDAKELGKKIAGKDVASAIEELKGMENVLGADVKLTPAIPGLNRLPFLANRIKLTVTPK